METPESVMVDGLASKAACEASTDEKETKVPLSTRIFIYLIAGFSTSGNFIAQTFTGLYAVFIESSASALSLITSLRNLIQQIFQFTFGRISDRIGRKILMLIGILISGISLALFPLIKNGWVLVAGVAVFSIGFSIYSPAFVALQGDITNKKNRAGFISLITIIGAIATLLGLIVVGFSGDISENLQIQYTIILEITAGLFIITAFISVFLHDSPREKLQEKIPFTLKPIIENKPFRKFVIVNSVMSFAMSIGWPLFPFVRGEFATPKENTWSWAMFSVLQIVTLIITYKTINSTKRKWLMFFGRIVMFYVPVNLALTINYFPYWWHLAIASAISGASNAVYMVGQNAYILDCANVQEKGTYAGVHNLFIGISTFFGSLIMGIIADQLIAIYDKWTILFILHWVVAGVRFLAGFGYLFLDDPKIVQKTTNNITGN